MKRSLYNMALAICTAAAMYSCSLDEYNPSDTSGEGELKTVEGLKNLGTYCYSPVFCFRLFGCSGNRYRFMAYPK